ncbi:glycosyltransferase [Vibrio pectenicida]|uniref:glycosyltransferase n=1 Tax=Vibrio pectenicida TaxID=62763 RepID=UPI003B9CD9E3
MNLYISVVNHDHDEMIITNSTLALLAKQFKVILKSNTPPSDKLRAYCIENKIILLHGKKKGGFGANNNEVFNYAIYEFQPSNQDYFLVLNPDVEIDVQSLTKLIEQAKKHDADISAINLFTDRSLNSYDNSIRRYPKLLSPLKSLFGIKRNDIYDKNKITKPIEIEWAAGSFLLFKISCFKKLQGFDEKYFMYFEDADICTRANKNGFSVYYFPSINAIHYANHQNRKLLSKHFIWYWRSSIRYQLCLRTL